MKRFDYCQLHHQIYHPQLWHSLTTGFTTGTVGVLFDLSFAALIFSGHLSQHLSVGFGLVLLSTAITRIIVACMSSLPMMVADLGTVPTAILAWSVGSIAKTLSSSATPIEILATVIAAIALTSLLTGAFLMLLGVFRVGQFVQRVPQAVVGGFVASTGWLLTKGAYKVMTDQPLELAQLPTLMRPDTLILWLPGLLLALHLLVVAQRRTHPFALPLSLVAAIGLFYAFLTLTGTSPAQASAQDLTLQVSATSQFWQPLSQLSFSQIHWSAIASQGTCIATIMLMTALSLLLNVSGLELVTGQKIDSDRELKVAGIANLAIGLGGGILSYHSLSKSVLAQKLGSQTRLATLVGAAVFIAASAFGSTFLACFPKAVLGGLLLFLGLSLLGEWVYTAWSRLSTADYVIVQVVWIVSGTVGFLQGLSLGWLIAAAFILMRQRNWDTKATSFWLNRRSP